MNNTLEAAQSRITKAEQWKINDLEDRMVKSLPQNIEKIIFLKNEDSLTNPWDNIKCTNIPIIGGPRRRRRKGPEKIFEEIITENFPNMGKEIANQIQEAQRAAGRINPRRATPKHM